MYYHFLSSMSQLSVSINTVTKPSCLTKRMPLSLFQTLNCLFCWEYPSQLVLPRNFPSRHNFTLGPEKRRKGKDRKDVLLREKPMTIGPCPSPQAEIIGQGDPVLACAQELVFRNSHPPSVGFLRTRGTWHVWARLLLILSLSFSTVLL